MALKILGAGFGRTGTTSLKIALERLGFGPCYHMSEVLAHPGDAEKWEAALDAPQVDWEDVLSGYVSAVDWPSTYFWKELADIYPDSKIILTERSPESWYESCMSTIFLAVTSEGSEGVRSAQQRMARKMVIERTLQGRWQDKEYAMDVFKKHNEEVKRLVPPGRLLTYDVKDGWAPLCGFLGVAVPDFDFPKVNTKDEFRARLNLGR